MRSGSTSSIDMGRKVQRALNMLKLQHLEDMYADRARPRYVKLCTGSSVSHCILRVFGFHTVYTTHEIKQPFTTVFLHIYSVYMLCDIVFLQLYRMCDFKSCWSF